MSTHLLCGYKNAFNVSEQEEKTFFEYDYILIQNFSFQRIFYMPG